MYFLREGKGRWKSGRETLMWEKHQWVASLRYPDQGSNPQLRHVPSPGMNPKPFSLQDDAPTNWATLVRAIVACFKLKVIITQDWSLGLVSKMTFDLISKLHANVHWKYRHFSSYVVNSRVLFKFRLSFKKSITNFILFLFLFFKERHF